MNTSDVIANLLTVPAITDIVGQKIVDTKIPTLSTVSGEVNVPYLWVSYRNDVTWDLQTFDLGTQPMGKSFDLEAVASSIIQANAIRDAVFSQNGYGGAMGAAVSNLLTVEDQSDDYAVRNMSDDSGVLIAVLLITIIGE